MARAFIAAFMLALFAAPSAGQGAAGRASDIQALRSRVERRFQILPLASGVMLTPRFKAAARSVEVADGTIAVDGAPVTGAELRQKFGADADLILQVSYLDAASRRSLAGISSMPATPQAPGAPQPPAPPQPPAATGTPAPETPAIAPETESQRGDDARPRIPRSKRREAVVRIGGSVKVASDER